MADGASHMVRPARQHLVDASVVAVIIGLGLVRTTGYVATVFTVALALPLLWRRRAPVGVFALVAVIAFAQWLGGVRAVGDTALLAALYTVAATQPLQRTLMAAGVLQVGIVLASVRWSQGDAPKLFISLSGLALAAGVAGLNARNRRVLLASLHDRAERLEHERDQQGRLAAAAERARIAREMHDVVAHNLSVMIALADGAGYAVRDDPDSAETAMSAASRTGRQALTEMRRLLGVLREGDTGQDLAPQPGIDAVEPLVEQVRAAGLPVRYQVSGQSAEELPPGVQLAAYRILQEALTNTLKHAGAGAEATVSVRYADDGIELEVLDTGLSPTAKAPEGAGLRGMRERAAVYDGAVWAGPNEGGGWRVEARLALTATAAVT